MIYILCLLGMCLGATLGIICAELCIQISLYLLCRWLKI